MKKIYSLLLLSGLLLLGAQSAWGSVSTVYYAIPVEILGSYTVDLNVKKGNNNWATYTMSDAGFKYGDCKVFKSTEVEDLYGGLDVMQFQLKNNGSYVSQKEVDSWTTVDTYSGKMFYHRTETFISVPSTPVTATGLEFSIHEVGSDADWSTTTLTKTNESDNTVEVSLSLSASKGYDFYIRATGTDWCYKNAGDMSSLDCTNWALTTGAAENAYLVTTIAGTYKFTYDLTKQEISIIYPSYSVAISDLEYATLCLPVEVSIPAGVDAYYESSYSYSSDVVRVGFTKISGDGTQYIPAGVPVILHAAEGTYAFPHTSENASDPRPAQRREFKGVYSQTGVGSLGLATNHSAYVLQDYEVTEEGPNKGQHHFGFHMLKNTGWVNASRCWLDVEVNTVLKAPAIEMSIDGETALPFVNADDNAVKAVKVIENGKVFILRNGIKYDATGRVVR